MFASQVGNILADGNKKVFSAIIWYFDEGVIKVSLRSIGEHNVSKLAEKYGGGGHKNAAGFIVKSLKDIPWKAVKK